MESTPWVLGIDIGGSHLTAGWINLENYELLKESYTRVRVNSNGTISEVMGTWSNTLAKLISSYPEFQPRLGFAMPGPFNYEDGISLITGLDKYEALYKQPIKALLAVHLNIDSNDIRMMNDAACFLKGEVMAGAARGYNHAIGMTLGTGTGSATFHNGITLDANLGPAPFMDSIADEYFSTRWFVKRYFQLTGVRVKDVKELLEVYGADNNIGFIFDEFSHNLSQFVKSFAEREKPEVLVIGGNIAQAWDKFVPELKAKLEDVNITMPIVRAQLGEEAALMGAASLFA